VEARDLTEYKVGLIEENIRRSGLHNVTAVQQDATVLDENVLSSADVVLADLPCSGLGILGKKPDLRYKMNQEMANSLVHLQREMLDVVHRYVKPGGTLLYSTCTIHKAENEGNVRWFLKEHPEYVLADIRQDLPEELRKYVQEEGMIQFLPGIHECDGFFLAKFKKNEGVL